MRAYIGQLFLILFFASIALVPPFFLTQGHIWNIFSHSKTNKQTLGVETQKEGVGMPLRLRIPRINVDAAVEYVGVTSNGIMDVPKKIIDVGWFNLGPRPGEPGSAVIAGHFDGDWGQAAIFANLNKLKVGDILFIEDDKGKTISFVVNGSRTYNPGFAEEVFSSNDGIHLNLVTCDGVWDGAKKSFTKRLVVFADIYENPK